MDTNLKNYITKYDRWLSEKTISFSSKVVPVKESMEPVKHVLPSQQAGAILANAHTITLAKCICRQKYNNCDNPLEVCFILDKTGEQWAKKGLSRKITLEEAQKVLTKTNQSGLVHLTLYKPDHALFALCSCCSCCCHDLQLVLNWGKGYILMHADYLAQDDSDLCIQCGECVARCPFNARKFDGETLAYESSTCYGCGLCVTTCPVSAIGMVKK